MTSRRRIARTVSLAVAGLTVAATSAAAAGGGIGTPDPPQIRDVICLEGCLDIREVAVGGTIEISGSDLSATASVGFAGGVEATPAETGESRIRVVVPRGARDGRVSLATVSGQRVSSRAALAVAPAKALDAGGGFDVTKAVAKPAKAYFDDKRRSSLEYIFKGGSRTDVRIDVVAAGDGEVVESIVQDDRKPFSNNSVRWNGLDSQNKIPPAGKYEFRITPLRTADAKPGKARFKYFDHIFPLRAKRHSYGDGIGAGRGHQGQDVFGKCGSKIVAARGGRVQKSGYHHAAGYYVVVDGAKTGRDYAYMHMEKRGRPKVGSRVRTGQRIGFTSDTGRASGCHLHFELWSAPGWYEGGKPLNPTRMLKRWDGWS